MGNSSDRSAKSSSSISSSLSSAPANAAWPHACREHLLLMLAPSQSNCLEATQQRQGAEQHGCTVEDGWSFCRGNISKRLQLQEQRTCQTCVGCVDLLEPVVKHTRCMVLRYGRYGHTGLHTESPIEHAVSQPRQRHLLFAGLLSSVPVFVRMPASTCTSTHRYTAIWSQKENCSNLQNLAITSAITSLISCLLDQCMRGSSLTHRCPPDEG